MTDWQIREETRLWLARVRREAQDRVDELVKEGRRQRDEKRRRADVLAGTLAAALLVLGLTFPAFGLGALLALVSLAAGVLAAAWWCEA